MPSTAIDSPRTSWSFHSGTLIVNSRAWSSSRTALIRPMRSTSPVNIALQVGGDGRTLRGARAAIVGQHYIGTEATHIGQSKRQRGWQRIERIHGVRPEQSWREQQVESVDAAG